MSLSEELGVDWNSQEIIDQKKRDANWESVAKKLSELQINQNHRRSAVESFYDTLLAFGVNNERLLEKIYGWTKTRSSDGDLVFFGNFGSLGARVDFWEPDGANVGLGVVSSR